MFQTGYKENEEHRMAISKKLDASANKEKP